MTVLFPVAQSFGIESHRIDRTPEHMAARFQVSASEPFNFSRPDEWTKWILRFERFRMASGLDEKGEAAQVNTLIYSMGDEGDDIFAFIYHPVGRGQDEVRSSEGAVRRTFRQVPEHHLRTSQIEPAQAGGGRASRHVYHCTLLSSGTQRLRVST